MPETVLTMSESSICLIISDIWKGFQCASAIKYVRFHNILRYIYNNIVFETNVIILEFMSARYVHTGAPQLTIFSFLTQVRT